MLAVLRRRGTGLAAVIAVLVLAAGCGKLGGGDGTVGVENADSGSSQADDNGSQSDSKSETNVEVNGKKVDADKDGNVKLDTGDVKVEINSSGGAKVSGNMPTDFDMCSNIGGKQKDMPKDRMPGPNSTGNFHTGMFDCVTVSSQFPGVNSEALRKQIIAEVTREMHANGVTITVK